MRDESRAMRGALICIALLATASTGCKRGRSHAVEDARISAPGDGSADPRETAAALDKKCVANDLEACRELAIAYSKGLGVTADAKRSTALFNLACSGGNLSACNSLALALAEGVGVDQDAARAVDLYQKACDGGLLLACRNLGVMLRDGHGVAADLPRAAKLLDQACVGKVPFACTNAGDLEASLAASRDAHAAEHEKAAIAHYQQGMRRSGCDRVSEDRCGVSRSARSTALRVCCGRVARSRVRGRRWTRMSDPRVDADGGNRRCPRPRARAGDARARMRREGR